MNLNRILIVINVRWWNAEAAYALNLAMGLKEANKEIWVLANQGSPVALKAKEAGLDVYEDLTLDSHSPWVQIQNYKKLKGFLLQNKIEVIHSFKSNGSILFSWAKRKLGILHIKTRGEARPPKINWMNRLLYGTWGADGVVSVGIGVQNWVNQLQIPEQNQTVIYYGMKPLKPREEPKENPIGGPLGIPKDHKVLALLGRTQPVKGHLILLQAFAELNLPKTHLLFMVKDLEEFPEVMTEIHQFISSHHLQSQVTITGFLPDLNPLLDSIDIGVIPSLGSEVNCRVACEFFNKKTPVLSFPTGSLQEIIHHKKVGYLCKDQSTEELKQGILWLLESEQRRKELGEAAYKSFKEGYTLERLAKQNLDFYQLCKNAKNKA